MRANFDLDKDEAIAHKEEDLLGRWPFASNICEIIDSIPEGQSIRIGLIGEWGSGKTVILNFIKTIESQQNEVVYVKLWGTASVPVVLQEIVRQLSNSLRPQDSEFTWNFLGGLSPNAASILNSEGAYFGMDLPSSLRSIKSLSNIPGKRVVVLFDDLERAEPNLTPDLFYLLRNGLNIPNMSFVVAYDPEAIKERFQFGSSSTYARKDYLNKIFDFSFRVPGLESDGIWSLIDNEFKALDIPLDFLEAAAAFKFLPWNPRRIRSFVRHLSASSHILGRFDREEVDAELVSMTTLLEVFSPGLCDIILGSAYWAQDHFSLGGSNREAGVKTIMESLTSQNIVPLADSESVSRIISRLDERFIKRSDFQMYSHLLDHPPIVTEKECKVIMLRSKEEGTTLESVIRTYSAESGHSIQSVFLALFLESVDIYARQLQPYLEIHFENTGIAADGLRTLSFLDELVSLSSVEDFKYGLGSSCFEGILKVHQAWGNWTREYLPIRERERSLLKSFIETGPHSDDSLLRMVAPWSQMFSDDKVFYRETCDLLFACLRENVIKETEASFPWLSLASKFRDFPYFYYPLFLDNDSVFWRPENLERLKQILSLIPAQSGITENAYLILITLSTVLLGKNPFYASFNNNVLKDAGTLQLLFDFATASRLSSRKRGELSLAKANIESELKVTLTTPDWLSQ
ncbi:MAG: P-loop NTPase fold protein [Bacteroidota bacterium]|nr:P-loop NTPase fold protein [Bacteroidota bacterium]MDP4232821.1 P-loop NTPase fold protein [Bacteroidota bacterium]MDP4242498.1 P-loop NTPase fold protein [Bacteroidota bacterium]MDP4289024.1 P-loop NTPase fold protein [Bacteroidota bacterium]